MGDKQSLKARNLRYLQAWFEIDPNKWIHKGDLCDKARELGYLHDNCARRLRELVREGLIEVRSCGKSIEYRYSPKVSF